MPRPRPTAPILGGPPTFTTAPEDDSAPPPPTIVAGQRVYISTQGDWWDLIALKVYGMRRFDDHLMHRLIEANYYLRQISNFPAGVVVIVPTVAVRTEIPLVPWKRAYVITSP